MEKEGHLKPPRDRRSAEVVVEVRERLARLALGDESLLHTPLPQATSTQERYGPDSLMDPYCGGNDEFTLKSTTAMSLESSLGILKEFGEDGTGILGNNLTTTRQALKSLSFNPGEMSGRSTGNPGLGMSSKENVNPNVEKCKHSVETPVKPDVKIDKLCIDTILRDMKLQSQGVDDILKASTVPDVANCRMSLNSFRQSLSSNHNGDKINESWNYLPPEFGTAGCLMEENSDLRDSMFVDASKVDITKEEESWRKEKAFLPVCPQLNLTDNVTPVDASWIGADNPSMSKMSVGHYFQTKNDDIRSIFNAISPEKHTTYPPLYVQGPDNNEKKASPAVVFGQTFNKSTKHSTTNLPFLTISDDTGLTDHVTIQDSRFEESKVKDNGIFRRPNESTLCKDVTHMTVDDTMNPLSVSQIQKIVGNFDSETPSILLDRMLNLNKNKKTQKSNVPPKSTLADVVAVHKNKKPDPAIGNKLLPKAPRGFVNISPTLSDKSSFGQQSNIFHSTRNVDGFAKTRNMKYSPGKLSTVETSQTSRKTPSPRNKSSDAKVSSHRESQKSSTSASYSAQFLSSQTLENSGGFVSTLKSSGKSNSGSTGFTESTLKSTNTVIAKHSTALNPIKENNKTYDKNILSASKAETRSSPKGSPRINISQENSSEGVMTPSDTSKELYGLVSPSSSNISSKTPSNSRPKRLMDKYQHLIVKTDKKGDANGWISPSQTKLMDSSKECNAALTPYKMESLDTPRKRNPSSPNRDYTQLNQSNANHSLNIPTEGDWIFVESKETDVYVGVSLDLDLKIKSLSSRWVSVEFSIDSISVDGTECVDDLTDIVLLQAPTVKILIKPEMEHVSTLKVISMTPDKDLKINLHIKLSDMVTKAEMGQEHIISLHSMSPDIKIQGTHKSHSFETIEFDTIPEECDTCLPVILWNDCSIDLPVYLEVVSPMENVFCIASSSIVTKEEAEGVMSSNIKLMHKNTNKTICADQENPFEFSMKDYDRINLTSNKNFGLKMLIYYKAPKISQVKGDGDIRHIHATLTISLAPRTDECLPILLQSIPITAGVGVSKLLIRNKHKTDILMVNQGTSEEVEMYNAGAIPMHYKLFMSSYHNGENDGITLLPCEYALFAIDKSTVTLKPNEKTVIKISYPPGVVSNNDTKRSLIFDNEYTTVFMQVIGIPSDFRSPSQLSGYSVESAGSTSQEIKIAATKTELSWGSQKIGEAKLQDITFKNTSSNKKLRVVATVSGDGFKVISDSGAVKMMMFTLQPQECRSLRIEFCPVRGGGHAGLIRIVQRTSPADKPQQLGKALLHGVGERSVLIFRDGIFRHGSTQGLPLGSLTDSGAKKEINFTIWNKGTAPGFVLINIELKWKYRSLAGEVTVEPQQAIVGPGAVLPCCVSVPRRALQLARARPGDTEAVAQLTILHGDEALRHRIKKICAEYIKDEASLDKWNQDSQGKLKALCEHFPEEEPKLSCLSRFKETPGVLKLLLDELQQKEVAVTYDVDLDFTVSRLSSDFDETLQFQAVCADSTTMSTTSAESL